MSGLTGLLLADSEIADLYQRATQSPFLRLGGQGRLPHEALSQWLSQDRLYAQAYVRFIGGLILRVKLPVRVDEKGTSATLEWRILTLLHTCLAGILREVAFFEETARSYNLDLAAAGPGGDEFGPNAVTQGYIELFDSFALQTKEGSLPSLFDGLVALWATEKAYLTAWSYAKLQCPSHTDFEKDLDGGALRKEFIPNWTSQPFQEFVQEIQECLDAYAENMPGESTTGAGLERAAAIVKKVLVLEKDFWPVIHRDEVA